MYLRTFNEEQQKDFLELAVYLSNVDGEFAESEKELINVYRQEIDLYEEDYEIMNKPLNNIIEGLTKSDPEVKRMIIIELIGLAYADKKIMNQETDLFNTLCKHFDISKDELPNLITNVIELKKIYEKFGSFIYQEVGV